MPSKNYYLFLIILASFLVVYLPQLIGTGVGFHQPATEANQSVIAINSAQNISALRILMIGYLPSSLGNVWIALICLIPIIGIGYKTIDGWTSGIIIGNKCQYYGVNPAVWSFILYCYEPFGILEMLAYVICIFESIMLTKAILKGEFKERLKTKTWFIFLVALMFLTLAAIDECYFIRGFVVWM